MKVMFEFTVWKELDIPEKFDKRFSGVDNGDMFTDMFYDITGNDFNNFTGGEIKGVYKVDVNGNDDDIIWEEI